MIPPPDDKTLIAGLRRITVHDPLPGLDAEALANRGRRGVRRRRWGTVALASGLVVVVVVAGMLVRPTLSAEPGLAGDPPSSGATDAGGPLAPLPGLTSGGEAALAPLTAAEATRRCALRHPGQGALAETVQLGAGHHIPFAGAARVDLDCVVPGDSQPTAAGLRAAAADPVPADRAGQLRNCSIALWHDVRDWRVRSVDTEPGVATSLVLSAPTGRWVALCNLVASAAPVRDETSEIRTHTPNGFDPLRSLGAPSSTTCDYQRVRCDDRIFLRDGRIDPRATRIVLESAHGRHEIRPWAGYFVLTWQDPAPLGTAPPKVTAYDRNEQVLFQR